MTNSIPRLDLSHGQALWALSEGRPPSQMMVDEVRYLRLLGVPFDDDEQGKGRGNRVRYRFDHLIELGVALFSLRRGMKPKEVSEPLIKERKRLRGLYRQAFQEQPEGLIREEWVKSRGRMVPILGHEIFLRLPDRYSGSPGEIEILGQEDITNPGNPLGVTERYPGETARTLLPLTRLVFELVAWALEAPETKPGPH
jgi:hypothetical protein